MGKGKTTVRSTGVLLAHRGGGVRQEERTRKGALKTQRFLRSRFEVRGQIMRLMNRKARGASYLKEDVESPFGSRVMYPSL
jgi:hypothetical protein